LAADGPRPAHKKSSKFSAIFKDPHTKKTTFPWKMRELKYHEQRLLKRVDFLNYKQDQNHRDAQVLRRYHIQNREDYFKYAPSQNE